MQYSKSTVLRFTILVCLGVAVAIIGGKFVDFLTTLFHPNAEVIKRVGGWLVGMVAVIPLPKMFGVINSKDQ